MRVFVIGIALLLTLACHDKVAPGAPSQAPSQAQTCTLPTLTADARHATVYFTGPTGAFDILIEVMDGSGWRDVEIISALSWSPTPPLGFGEYRARVRVPCSDWSDPAYFTFGGPPYTPPAPESPTPPVLVTATVCWTGAEGFFLSSIPPRRKPVSLPAGRYRVEVETRDDGHRAGYQTDQTEEVVTVWGVGTTRDIPETEQRQMTVFNITILTPWNEVVVEGGRHSVHGVCVTFRQW